MASEFLNFRPWEYMVLSEYNIDHLIEQELRCHERLRNKKAITEKQRTHHYTLICETNKKIELLTLLKKKINGKNNGNN